MKGPRLGPLCSGPLRSCHILGTLCSEPGTPVPGLLGLRKALKISFESSNFSMPSTARGGGTPKKTDPSLTMPSFVTPGQEGCPLVTHAYTTAFAGCVENTWVTQVVTPRAIPVSLVTLSTGHCHRQASQEHLSLFFALFSEQRRLGQSGLEASGLYRGPCCSWSLELHTV